MHLCHTPTLGTHNPDTGAFLERGYEFETTTENTLRAELDPWDLCSAMHRSFRSSQLIMFGRTMLFEQRALD